LQSATFLRDLFLVGAVLFGHASEFRHSFLFNLCCAAYPDWRAYSHILLHLWVRMSTLASLLTSRAF